MKRSHSAFEIIVTVLFIGFGVLWIGPQASTAQSRIMNFVSAGGPDVDDADLPFETGPGIDKNYSLTAFLFSDGAAEGILIDGFAGGQMGYRARIDCVYVEGNNAWVSGVIEHGLTVDENGEPFDVTGWYVRTRAQDNGPNNDPANPDRIGISVVRPDVPWICSEKRGGLFDMPRGQAIVR